MKKILYMIFIPIFMIALLLISFISLTVLFNKFLPKYAKNEVLIIVLSMILLFIIFVIIVSINKLIGNAINEYFRKLL